MKIISGNDCYVQKRDLEYLIDNNQYNTIEIYNEYKQSVFNDSDFIKINNYKVKECIINSDIPSFDELSSISINKLEELIFKIKLDIFDDDLTEEEISDINELLRIRRNREYLLNQLKEIVKYKKGISTLKYPSVPNNNYESITDGTYNASISINYNEVLIYSNSGSKISNPDDIEFCKVAYNLLMHDIQSEEINLQMLEENDYIIVKNIYKRKVFRK